MRYFVALVAVAFLFGCGGGSGPDRTANVNATIDWAARSRNLSAPSSALSATFTLVGAKPGGGDFSFTVNRDANPAAYTKSYTSHNQARVGTWPLHVRFYSTPDGDPGGGGPGGGGVILSDVVGYIDAVINLKHDGSGIGNFTTTGTITQVIVDPNQTVGVGQTTDLSVTTLDVNGRFVAVMLGSVFLKLVGGGGVLSVTPKSQVTGLSVGTAQVVATVDGIQSSPQDVTVAYVPVVTVTPSTVTTLINGSIHFSASVTQSPDDTFTWSVPEGQAGGSIDANGNYAAPSTAGTYHVVATSHFNTSRTATATVTVSAASPGTAGIYVSDFVSSRIARLDDLTGKGWITIGTLGGGRYQFNGPHIFVTQTGVIYVADQGNNRIVRMDDMTGRNWTELGATGSGTGQFNRPSGICLGPDGKIYVTDLTNNRLIRMDDITGSGWTVLPVNEPVAVTVDSSNRFYVADYEDPFQQGWIIRGTSMSASGLVIYSNPGTWQGAGPMWPDVNNPDGLFVAVHQNVWRFAGPGDPYPEPMSNAVGPPWDTQLFQPQSVFQSADSHIYFSHSNGYSNAGIARFDGLTGANFVTFGQLGDGIGQFRLPNGIFAR